MTYPIDLEDLRENTEKSKRCETCGSGVNVNGKGLTHYYMPIIFPPELLKLLQVIEIQRKSLEEIRDQPEFSQHPCCWKADLCCDQADAILKGENK